jgi:hypothetical protein
VNQTNFLAELHTRTDEQAALEEQANEEFHEEMQRQAQERDLTVSALAEQQRRQKLLEKQQKAKARKQRNVRSPAPKTTCSLLPGMMKVFFRLHNFLTARLLPIGGSNACKTQRCCVSGGRATAGRMMLRPFCFG